MNLLRLAFPILLMLVLSLELAAQQQTTNQLPTLELINGSWFDGRDFRPRTMYSADGLLKKKRAIQVDQVVDLKHGYVVPPFGEAHTHRPSTPDRLRGTFFRPQDYGTVKVIIADGNVSQLDWSGLVCPRLGPPKKQANVFMGRFERMRKTTIALENRMLKIQI